MAAIAVVVQKNDHSLGYYDLTTGLELARVALDPYPHEFALSPDGRYAYSCHFGVALAEDEGPGGNTVSIVDIPARRRVGTIDCGPWRRPHGIAVDSKGRIYVLSEGESELLVCDDPSSGRFDRHQPTGGAGSHIVTVCDDGRLAFSSNMKSNTLSILFPGQPERQPVVLSAGARPEGSAIDAEERRLYVTNRESADLTVIDVKRQCVVDRIDTPPGPVRLCWDSAGRLLVALYHQQGLARIEPTRADRMDLLTLPGRPISVAFDATGNRALLSTLDDEICLVDLDGWRLAGRIVTRAGPDPIALVSP